LTAEAHFPHILITNDDGIHAPGLLALAQALKTLGRVSVIAPDRNWSVAGHAKTFHKPLRVKEVELADGTPALCTDGSPSDCVAMACLGLIADPLDLVVSGINSAPNLGSDITYSGTVTAAMEGVICGVQSIAVSLNVPVPAPKAVDYRPAAKAARFISEKVLLNGLPGGMLLNVNIPFLPEEEIKGYRLTRQGQRIYRDFLVKREDPFGKPYYWIGGEVPTGVIEQDTDIGELAQGYISITPIHLDMTAHHFFDALGQWGWS
jgi:5'-nucleotidase